MKLGLSAGYWSAGPPAGIEEQIDAAERLGFDSLWTAEAYGSDCFTPLAWWGSRTSRLRLGTAVAQLSARTPTATAMAAMTLDHLSGGRACLGVGVSGPQVVEGWYGQPFDRPLERTREHIAVIRSVMARQEPVRFAGRQVTLPHPGGTGLGKPLKSTLHPLRSDLPILLAAEGPKNVALAGEIADGWLPLFFSPKSDEAARAQLVDGFARRDDDRRGSVDAFEVVAAVPLVPGPDVEACADLVRPMLALYIGGMGARGANFHHDVFARMGWADVCAEVQERYLAGDKQAAAAAIPTALVEDVALIGPEAKIADDLERWRSTCITTMLVSGPPPVLELAARLVLG